MFRKLSILFTAFAVLQSQVQAQSLIAFDLPAQPLAAALKAVANQTNTNVLFERTLVAGLQAPALKAELTVREAIGRLLAGTDVKYEVVNEHTIVLASAADKRASGNADASSAAITLARVEVPPGGQNESATAPEKVKPTTDAEGVPEIMVKGAKILNMDIKRSRDNPQPYVIIDRTIIEQSGAVSIGDLLKQRLTMNSAASQANQSGTSLIGNSSSINLRGMGAQQTLILVDGRRVPDFNIGNFISQASVNGIPLSAVERIEILPTTAGGIYGGSATGGVVNVILRRDYSGAETKLTYAGTFDSGAASRQVDVSAGFNLEEGRTNVLIAGSYSTAGQLSAGDRDFAQRGRERILANNPGFFLNANNPPLGSTTNIRSTTGANLTLDNGTPLNSPITFVPRNYLGRAANDGGAAMVANAGRYNFELAKTSQAFDGSAGLSMLNGPQVKSLMTTLRRQFTPRIDGFMELGGSENAGRIRTSFITSRLTLPGSAPGNPFQQTIIANVPTNAGDLDMLSTTKDLRWVGGAIVKLPASWSAGADYTWQRSRMNYSAGIWLNNAAATAAAVSGALDVFRDTGAYPLDYSNYLTGDPAATTLTALAPWAQSLNKTITARASGPVNIGLPKSPIVSFLLERREMSLNRSQENSFTSGLTSFYPQRSQDVDSAYVEIQFPLIAPADAVPLVRELKLQLAGRHDNYTTFASGGNTTAPIGSAPPADTPATNKVRSTDPTVALTYEPVEDVKLRASWGTGFLPPPTNRLIVSVNTGSTVTDPLRGNSSYIVPNVPFGGNPDLKPEVTESWSAGLILTPRFIPGLRLSLDYTAIDKTDGISANLTTQFLFDNEAILPSRVVRGAKLPGDAAQWAGPVTFMDLRPANFSKVKIRAYDLQLDQRVELGAYGSLELLALSTWTPHYITQVISSVPEVELAGVTRSNPLKFKGNAGVTWNYRNLTLNWTTYYYDSYFVADPAGITSATAFLNQGGRTVSSQMYHDLYAKVGLERLLPGLGMSGTELTLGVKNVLNTRPAFEATAFPYYSVWADPRMASYYLSLKTNF